MHLVDFPLPDFLLIISTLIAGLTLVYALLVAPWGALIKVPERQHLFFFAIICLVILWLIKITWVKGFLLHPLGMTAVTVIFGWRLAIILGSIALLAFELLSHGQWMSMPVDYLFTVLLPVTLSYLLIRLVQSWQSRNLFVFVLGVGFIGAMLGVLIDVGLIMLLAYSVGYQTFVDQLGHKFAIIIMLLNVEGFLNGAVVTAMSVFAPQLVKSFDDRKYLG